MPSKQVTLDPGQSVEVSFSFIPTVAKTYFAAIDGLSGSFTAVELPAEFEVSNLIIEPSEVDVGEPVTISCVVTNVGGQRGTKTITLEVT